MSMDVIDGYHESIPHEQDILVLPGLNDKENIISPGHFEMLISRALNKGASFEEINQELVRTLKGNDLDLSYFNLDLPNNDTVSVAGLALPSPIDANYLDVLTENGLVRLVKFDNERFYELQIDDKILEDLTERLKDAGDVLQTYLRKKLSGHTIDMENLEVIIDLQKNIDPTEDDYIGLAA